MPYNLSNITPYIVTSTKNKILEILNKQEDKIVDIAGCHLLSGADEVIAFLIHNNYEVIDTLNKQNDDILRHNRNVIPFDVSEVKKIPDKPVSYEELYQKVDDLNVTNVYLCSLNNCSVVLLSQILRPEIKWYIPQSMFSMYINYAFTMLYNRNKTISVNQFYEILKIEKKFMLYANNTLYPLEMPENFSLKAKVRFPNDSIGCTWLEAIYKKKIFPQSLGILKHIPTTKEDAYYFVINNILNSLVIKNKTKRNFKKFAGGNIDI